MGYACPVCDADQPDGDHLANHMAFTAMLRSDDHEDWLEDRVPDWPDMNPDTLAPEITPYAPETETEVVTEAGAHPNGLDGELARHGGYGRDSLSSDQQVVLEEAEEMTRQMYGLDEFAEAEGVEDDEGEDVETDAKADSDDPQADSESQ